MSTLSRSRLAVEPLEDRLVMAGDVVLTWNEVLLDAVRADRTAPPVAARAMAIVHTAVYDAVNAVDRTHDAYHARGLAHPRASAEAAVAAAAHRALSALFPAQRTAFDTALADSLAAIPDGRAEDGGVALGRRVADRILALRRHDGSTTVVRYTPGADPGDWRPTPPALAPALLPQWPQVTPWAMTSGDQFRPEAPPELDSTDYTSAFNEVKAIGSATSTTRTSEQTAIALFWANGPGTSTPPGHWNVVAQTVAQVEGNTLADNARLFALLNIALADAAVVSWDAKYAYNFWRPVTAIREAATDGNPDTDADASWTPLLATPPFPAYTSGHSTFSGAAAAVLAGFFGREVGFTLPSEDPAAGNRSYAGFADAARESGLSRIYGGIHYAFDNSAGLDSGQALGEYVVEHFLRPRRAAPAAGLEDGRLIVLGSDSGDVITVGQEGSRLVVRVGGAMLGRFDPALVQAIVVDSRDGDDVVLVGSRVRADAELYGGRGDDLLAAGGGHDLIFGEEGNDLLLGRADDLLDGGPGRDRCLFV